MDIMADIYLKCSSNFEFKSYGWLATVIYQASGRFLLYRLLDSTFVGKTSGIYLELCSNALRILSYLMTFLSLTAIRAL